MTWIAALFPDLGYVLLLVAVVLGAVLSFLVYLSRQSCKDCQKWKVLHDEMEQSESDWEAMLAHPIFVTETAPRTRKAKPKAPATSPTKKKAKPKAKPRRRSKPIDDAA